MSLQIVQHKTLTCPLKALIAGCTCHVTRQEKKHAARGAGGRLIMPTLGLHGRRIPSSCLPKLRVSPRRGANLGTPGSSRNGCRHDGVALPQSLSRAAPQCAMVSTANLESQSSCSGLLRADQGQSGSFLVHGFCWRAELQRLARPRPEGCSVAAVCSCRLPLSQTATASNHRTRHLPARRLNCF